MQDHSVSHYVAEVWCVKTIYGRQRVVLKEGIMYVYSSTNNNSKVLQDVGMFDQNQCLIIILIFLIFLVKT